MPHYMTRVELHGAALHDYQNLHSYMHEAGFSTIIVSATGQSYHLPPAEYYMFSSANYSASQIRDYAKTAVDRTLKRNAVMTSKSDDIAWQGLVPVSTT